MAAERERCEAWLLNYWRSKGYGVQLTEAEHLASLRNGGDLDAAWDIWQGALASGVSVGPNMRPISDKEIEQIAGRDELTGDAILDFAHRLLTAAANPSTSGVNASADANDNPVTGA